MKFCISVCEYNPFHNGHLYHLRKMKEIFNPDYTVLIMSGNFTQRGEIAVMDKFTRAKHAILGGADAVIELPTVFATANAEIFADGAVKLLNNLPDEKILCFGSESGIKDEFISTAFSLNNETKEFKKLLKAELESGCSMIKAKTNALKKLDLPKVNLNLLDTPNNILGLEYTRAILRRKCKIDVCPIPRIGSDFSDDKLASDFSSATAIRKTLHSNTFKKIKSNVPKFVYKDLSLSPPDADNLIFFSLLEKSREDLKRICDCTEGLENRIKSFLKDSENLDALKRKVVTKRYTSTRINRIFINSFLSVDENLIRSAQKSNLYLKVLALNADKPELLGLIKQSSKAVILTRKNDAKILKDVDKACFERDTFANDVYNFLSKQSNSEHFMSIIKRED